MRRFVSFLAAAALAGPALAQAGLQVSLAQPATQARVVAHETLWTCAGADCRAPRSGLSSDVNECRAVARKLGRVARFAVAGKPFDQTQLDRCNAGISG